MQPMSSSTKDVDNYQHSTDGSDTSTNKQIYSNVSTMVSIRESEIERYEMGKDKNQVSNPINAANVESDTDEIDSSDEIDKGLYKDTNNTLDNEKVDINDSAQSTKCYKNICHPELEIIKDKDGRHEGIVKCYGKGFSYKQLIGFGIFFVSFTLILSAICIDSWTFCEGTTESEHSISVIWTSNKLKISIGDKTSSSMLYKNVLKEVSQLDHSDLMKHLPTVFDDDYDYTQWPKIQHALNEQSDNNDLITLLEWSENYRIKKIEYRLNLMHIFNIICECFLLILMVLILVYDDKYAHIQYLFTFITFMFILLSIIYWGTASKNIEMYNHLLWCHTGDSFILLSTGMANLFLILFIYTLPKRNDIHTNKYKSKKEIFSENDQHSKRNSKPKTSYNTAISEIRSNSQKNSLLEDNNHSKLSDEETTLLSQNENVSINSEQQSLLSSIDDLN